VLLLGGSSLAAFASAFPVISSALSGVAATAALPAATKVSRAALGAALSALAWDVRTRAVKVNTSAPGDVFDYYMYIWKVFYGCYFLLPLVR
jgi:NAD(P)-dependent dehydrogenase (short-subunit alcohol dehydrogenase family)